jgi:hypothetical protein
VNLAAIALGTVAALWAPALFLGWCGKPWTSKAGTPEEIAEAARIKPDRMELP